MTQATQPAGGRLIRILSIDGGGIRGILPGQILVALENELQAATGDANARIADYFDLIAGTSTGGILTCLYLCPDASDPERPRFTAQEAVDLYLERGDEIFETSLWQRITSLRGAADEKYDADELESALEDYFGDLRLGSLLRPCLVTAYDIQRRRPHFFTQHDADDPAANFYVRDVCRATSAAPTYFEVAHVESLSKIMYPLIDGGVFANNPALCAYAEARVNSFSGRPNHPTAAQMAILSLGTGSRHQRYRYWDAKDWGAVAWIKPVLDIMMSGNSDTVSFQLRQIYDAVERRHQYLRIEPDLGEASTDLDDASASNLSALRDAGTRAAAAHRGELAAFARLLVENA